MFCSSTRKISSKSSIERHPLKSVNFGRTGRFLKSTEAGKLGHIPIKSIVKSFILPAGSL